MKILVFALTIIASQTTFAASTEVWEGPGSLFDVRGNFSGTYNLVVENTKSGHQMRSNVTVTLPNGTSHKHQCIMTEAGAGWNSECDHGKGGGRCYGEGLCLSYEKDSTGKAYATTIVMDGPSDMRLLRTALQNGQAVQIFREKLHKR